MCLVGVLHAEPNIQALDRGRYCQAEEPRPETTAASYCRRTRSIAVSYRCKGAPAQIVAKGAAERRGDLQHDELAQKKRPSLGRGWDRQVLGGKCRGRWPGIGCNAPAW